MKSESEIVKKSESKDENQSADILRCILPIAGVYLQQIESENENDCQI